MEFEDGRLDKTTNRLKSRIVLLKKQMGRSIHKAIIHLKKDYRRCLIKLCLVSLQFSFAIEDGRLKQLLKECGFHLCLQMHPSILFFSSKGTKCNQTCKKMRERLLLLRRLIEQGTFFDNKDRKMLRDVGVNSYFVNDISRMLANSGKPFVPYCLPQRDLLDEKIVVYSVLTGNYDKVHEILYKQQGVEYVLFTNNRTLTSTTWDVRYLDNVSDDLLLSRKVKMLPHKFLDKAYSASVYIDANAYIFGEISTLVSFLDEGTVFAVTRHSNTDSVKEELDVCVRTKGVNPKDAEKQYERYRKEGFKDDMGLAECGILVRRNNDLGLQALMELWFKEFCEGIRRDQISLLPCIKKMSFKRFKLLQGSVWHNQFCIIHGEHDKS